MKRLLLSFLMSMALWSTATSQLTLLVEGGANYGKARLFESFNQDALAVSNITIELTQHENITGYFFAVTPKFGILNNLGAFAELQYSVEGFKVEPNDFNPVSRRNVHYIRLVPGMEVDIFGPLSVIGGMDVGFRALENTIPKGNGNMSTFNYFDDTDYGVLLGLNTNILGLNLSLKYNLGLKNVNEFNLGNINGISAGTVRTRNRFLQFGLGYEFGL